MTCVDKSRRYKRGVGTNEPYNMNNSGDTTHLICVADGHINLAVSVRPPVFVRDNGDESRASRPQRWLWECWLDFWKQVGQLDGQKVLLSAGDMVELDTKRRSNALITTNKADVLRLTWATLEPAIDAVDKAIWIRGTPAHVGKSGWSEEDIASDCTITVPEHEGRYSWERFSGVVGGIRVDAQHYSSMGAKLWTEKNAANNLAALIEAQYGRMSNKAERYIPPPHVAIAAHNHRYSESGRNFKTRAYTLPAWTLPTEYILMKGGREELADIGGVIITRRNGEITDELRLYEPQGLRRIWALKI